jgi:glycerol uptake facilitator-like aquaporin
MSSSALAVLMYGTKRWSGGHLNPAITTALLLIGEAGMEVQRWSSYCAAQMLGAIAGAAFLRIFCPETAISRNPFVTQASANKARWYLSKLIEHAFHTSITHRE